MKRPSPIDIQSRESPLNWPELCFAGFVFVAIMTIIKRRLFIWIGGYLRRFGGGKIGGGGAGGKYKLL